MTRESMYLGLRGPGSIVASNQIVIVSLGSPCQNSWEICLSVILSFRTSLGRLSSHSYSSTNLSIPLQSRRMHHACWVCSDLLCFSTWGVPVRVVDMLPLLVWCVCQAVMGFLWGAPVRTLWMSVFLSFRTCL